MLHPILMHRCIAIVVVGIGLAAGLPTPASTQTLDDALTKAYQINPNLEAARQDLVATRELLPQAYANYRAALDFAGTFGATQEITNTQDEDLSANANASLNLTQPVFRGGAKGALFGQATAQVQTQEAIYQDTEQTVLFDTAAAFTDVWHDQAVLDLVVETLELVKTERDGVARQKELGAATSTDVAQANARLSQIEADRIVAKTNLGGSRARFEKLTGMEPGLLQQPIVDLTLPQTLDEAIIQVLSDNPKIKAARFRETAAQREIDRASAEHWPSVDLRAALQYFSADIQDQGNELEDDVAVARIEARVTMPLYAGGAISSRVREARATAQAEHYREQDVREGAEIDTRGAWNRMMAARNQIDFLEQAVEAAKSAVDGTKREYQLGKRTTLDLLDTQRELLDLQTALLDVRRDAYGTTFELLTLIGQFTAEALDLDRHVGKAGG